MTVGSMIDHARHPFLLVVFLILAPTLPSQNAVKLQLPKQMSSKVSADTGQPVIFDRNSALTYGVSAKTVLEGDPITVLLWLYNPTDVPQPVMSCEDIDWFWSFGIDVFNSSGQRVLSRLEQYDSSDPGLMGLPICSRNFAFRVPPHTCMHGSFSKLNRDFSRDLRAYYSLSPGRYLVVPSERDENYQPRIRTLSNLQMGLRVEVKSR